MITILTAFKPFVGQAHVHQTNALASWRALRNDLEIVAFDSTGDLTDIVAPFNVTVVRDVPVSDDGRARVDAIFDYSRLHGRHDRQVYVNGDILLGPDFIRAFESIRFERFLMVGQRTDVDVETFLSFEDGDASADVLRRIASGGTLHEVRGLDYFAYKRGSIPALPPLFLGAAGWDNLMLYFCRRAGVPVIDASGAVTALHQNHAYYEMRSCPSAQANLAQAPEESCFFSALDASHWLDGYRTRTALSSPRHAFRWLSNYPLSRGWPKALRRPFRLTARLAQSVGWL